MAHSKSAEKRIRQNERCRDRNKARKSEIRTITKRVHKAVKSGDAAQAGKELVLAQKKLDKAAKTNVLHKNNAARKKSALARAVASIAKQ